MPPTEGQAWKYFNTVVKERNGNRVSGCLAAASSFNFLLVLVHLLLVLVHLWSYAAYDLVLGHPCMADQELAAGLVAG